MPSASIILLLIALLLFALVFSGYRREGVLKSQHRTWLTVAVIFVLVALGTSAL